MLEKNDVLDLHTKFYCLKAAENATCDYTEGDLMLEHILNKLQFQTWPEPTDLSTKVW